MEEYFFILAASLIIGQSVVQIPESTLLLVGGVSHIHIDSLDQSQVLDSFEILGCSGSSLPNYPIEVFGANIVWLRREQEEGLLVCGGANWKMTYKTCFMWSPR